MYSHITMNHRFSTTAAICIGAASTVTNDVGRIRLKWSMPLCLVNNTVYQVKVASSLEYELSCKPVAGSLPENSL